MKSRWRDVNEVIDWYEALDNVERLSVHSWLNTGDTRLLCRIARRVFIIKLSVIRIVRLFSADKLA